MISFTSKFRLLVLFSIAIFSASSELFAESPEPPPLPESLDGEIPENLLPFDPIKKRTPEAQKKVDAGAHFMNGVVLEKRREFQEAMREYGKAIQTDPTAVEAYRALIRLNLRFNRRETAQALLVQALKQAPQDVNLLQLLGANLRNLRQYEQAIEAFEKALASPEIEEGTQQHTLLMLELGPLYRGANMDEKAADLYEKIFTAAKIRDF